MSRSRSTSAAMSCSSAEKRSASASRSLFSYAHGDVAGRQVRQDRGAGQGGHRARRNRDPEVLAALHVQAEPPHVRGLEQEVAAERHPPPQERHLAPGGLPAGAELALLVELPVVRQVALGHDPEHLAPVHGHRAVEQPPVEPERRADQQDRPQGPALLHQGFQGPRRGLEQGVLLEQVLVGVGCEAELREERHRGVPVRGAAGQIERAFQVEARVGHAHVRDAHRGAHEPVGVDGVERRRHGRHGPRLNGVCGREPGVRQRPDRGRLRRNLH